MVTLFRVIFYRYFESDIALKTLGIREMKVAKVSLLNDPFEFIFQVTGRPSREQIERGIQRKGNSKRFLERYRQEKGRRMSIAQAKEEFRSNKEKIIENLYQGYEGWIRRTLLNRAYLEEFADSHFRMICFSAENAKHEMLMWSHYAKNHTGVRVGFTLPIEKLFFAPVEYGENRVILNGEWFYDNDSERDRLLMTATRKAMFAKSSSWEYEAEHRLIVHPKDCISKAIKGSKMEFLKFPASWVTSLDFGLKFQPAKQQAFIDLLRNDFSGVNLQQAGYHDSKYELDYRLLNQ